MLLKDKAEKNWLARSAESLELDMEEADSEEERVNVHKKNKAKSNKIKQLQQVVCFYLSQFFLVLC